jgi:uncharacterized protein
MNLRRVFGLTSQMRDGTELVLDVTIPARGGPFPTILVRTPYERTNDRLAAWASWFGSAEYAFVAQDVRGRGDSGGDFEPWIQEFDDGFDTIAWVAEQSWCNGSVGMLGGSYEAWVQWSAASRNPVALRAMVTSGSPGRWFRDWPYRFGALFAADYVEWLARTSGRLVQPVPFPDWSFVVHHLDPRRLDADSGRPLPGWQFALDHDTYDDYWHSLDVGGYEDMDIAVLQVTGWWDACSPGEYHHFRQMAERSPARDRHSLVIGPFDHHAAVVTGKVVQGDLEIPASGALGMETMWIDWFDRHLVASPRQRSATAGAPPAQPPVRFFSLGDNVWRDATDWPPASATQHSWYLTAGGSLAEHADGESRTREYTYDPSRPVVSMAMLHHRDRLEWAPRSAVLVEGRDDVLSYQSDPVDEPLLLAGRPVATLYAASSGVDTDFVVSLGWVRDNGSCTLLVDGILRAAMRDSLEHPEPLEPGRVYEFVIELNDIALRLHAGEALRVVISSSLAPHYQPNPNTGEGYGGSAPPVPARQRILHGGTTASHITVPVLTERR